jgi:hypothetical protein
MLYTSGFKIQMTRFEKLSFLIFNLVVSAFLLTMMWLGQGKLTFSLVLFSIVVCMVLTQAGKLTLHVNRITMIKASLPLAFVLGFVAVSLSVMAFTLIVHMSALMAFLIVALVVLSLSFISVKNAPLPSSSDWADTAIALVLALSIGLFARIPVSSAATLLNTGVFPLWSDYFIHGITIASFGSTFSTGTDLELAGGSRYFYHYAPFMIPAAFQGISGMSGLALATSMLLPFGLLIAAFGSYVLAETLGGRTAGWLAVTAIICLPASSAIIQSGWFDFYWLLFISPGTGYAIGVSSAVCALIATYLNTGSLRLLCFTLLLLASIILVRVHMFMLLAPAVVAVLLVHRYSRRIRFLSFVALSTIIAGASLLHFSSTVQELWIHLSNPHGYFNQFLRWTLFYGQKIAFLENPGLPIFVQVLIAVVAVLGAYFALYPISLYLKAKQFGFRAIDALPLFLLVSFVGLMLFAPVAGNGDPTEYKHRHFPLLYVIVAVYTIANAVRLVGHSVGNEKKFNLSAAVLVGCCLFATLLLNRGVNPARPNIEAMPWAGQFHNQRINPGILESAEYLRRHAKYGDVFAMGISPNQTAAKNPVVQVISLSSVPAFVSRPELKKMGGGCVQKIVTKRMDVLKQLSILDDWLDAKSLLQANGIRWFLVSSEAPSRMDPALKNAVFSSYGVSVYDADVSAMDKNTGC